MLLTRYSKVRENHFNDNSSSEDISLDLDLGMLHKSADNNSGLELSSCNEEEAKNNTSPLPPFKLVHPMPQNSNKNSHSSRDPELYKNQRAPNNILSSKEVRVKSFRPSIIERV
mgnify:CR=1 FL=1